MYNYQDERSYVFTDEGQRNFLKIRDHIGDLLKKAGAFKMINVLAILESSNAWQIATCVYRLVELNEIKQVNRTETVAMQDEIFIRW
jgi:hypothetical protein